MLSLYILWCFFFQTKNLKGISPFVGQLISPFWTSGDLCSGLQSQDGSLTCMLCQLCTMNSSDSLLVWHLLNSWWPAWQPGHLIQFMEFLLLVIHQLIMSTNQHFCWDHRNFKKTLHMKSLFTIEIPHQNDWFITQKVNIFLQIFQEY